MAPDPSWMHLKCPEVVPFDLWWLPAHLDSLWLTSAHAEALGARCAIWCATEHEPPLLGYSQGTQEDSKATQGKLFCEWADVESI